MAEIINDKQVFSLLEVTNSIRKTINDRYGSSFWIKAEMNKLNHYSHSGHCYPDLVEKQDGKVIAEMRATLWRPDFERINAQFQKILKEPLKDGIKILFLARINYDPKYGISLSIQDIDPSFTLGDLEKEKQLSIQKLREEGIFDQNKTLSLPLLPQRIAIISVETSKGYADFLKVIEGNQWNYKFFHLLFPSLLQGDKAPMAITGQLKQIRKVKHHFDMVAIIRGGGGDIGLACYNDFELAKEIATFPLPVLTGIGHATNETVSEMIAYSNQITPTKLAEYLIQKFHDFSVPVQRAEEKIVYRARRLLSDKNLSLRNQVKYFKSLTENILSYNKTRLAQLPKMLAKDIDGQLNRHSIYLNQSIEQIERNSDQLLKDQKQLLQSLEKNIEIMSPQNVLKRGFSITLVNGKSVRSTDELKSGQELETHLFEGKVISTIESIQKSKEE